MKIIERYRDQHKIIISLCKQLISLGTIDEIKNDPDLVVKIFTTLDNILQMHLQSEDENFYPALVDHDNPEIQKTSVKLQDELLATTQVYEEYKAKYPSQKSIQDDPSTYVDDTNKMVEALLERINTEETQLYTLFK